MLDMCKVSMREYFHIKTQSHINELVMSIQVTSLDQLEVGTVIERNWSGNTTHWVVKAIQPFPMSQGIMSVYADRVRKSDHKVIVRGSNGLPTYSTVLAHFSMVWNRTTQKIGQLHTYPYTLTVIESKQAVEQPEEEERLSICCGADEDENIENMCLSLIHI